MKAERNDPCPCGSGKKYKKCCLPNEEANEVKYQQELNAVCDNQPCIPSDEFLKWFQADLKEGATNLSDSGVVIEE